MAATGAFPHVMNEPFGFPFYHGPERISTRYSGKTPDPRHTFDLVIDSIYTAAQTGPVLFKDMATHVREALLSNERGREFISSIQHAFVLRRPHLAISSLAKPKHWPDFTFRETGFEESCLLYDGIAELTGTKPVIIDGSTFQKDPVGLLMALSHHFRFEYDGMNPTWTTDDPRLFGEWAKDWFEHVRNSTGVENVPEHADAQSFQLQPHVRDAIERSLPFYNYLAQHFLQPVLP